MKALTVWQPWATLIAIGAKPYEFRSWSPPRWLIGQRIAIHAGVRPVRQAEVRALVLALRGRPGHTNPCMHRDLALPMLEHVLRSLKGVENSLFGTEEAAHLPLGHVICTAVVGQPKHGAACAAEFGEAFGNDSERPGTFNWGWPMLDIRHVIPPMPVRGAQGLWDVAGVEHD